MDMAHAGDVLGRDDDGASRRLCSDISPQVNLSVVHDDVRVGRRKGPWLPLEFAAQSGSNVAVYRSG